MHAIRGKEVCRMHGGKSLLGPASPHYRNGLHSKFLPSRLAAAYTASVNDPKLLELRHDIATLDARIIDLLTRVDTGESGALWREAQAAVEAFDQAQARKRVTEMHVHLDRLKTLIRQGAGDSAAWQEICGLIEQRRKLVDSEQKRLATAHEMLTSEQAMVLLGAVVATIQKHVTDREILGAIALDLSRLGTVDRSGTVH
jgi:hypothetical protein